MGRKLFNKLPIFLKNEPSIFRKRLCELLMDGMSCPGLFAGLSRLLFANSADLPTANRCEKCQWPLCSNKCKGLYRRHGHSKEECEQLTTCPVSSTQLPNNQLFNAITPLRCLLLKLNQPEQWTTLISMEAHNDVRRKLPSVWDYNQKTVVDRITQDWKITAFSPEEIHTVCGVLEVNAFAVGEDSLSIRGLYPTAFYIAHSCVPNTSHTDDEEFRMKVFTSVQVAKDEMITLSYTNSLQRGLSVLPRADVNERKTSLEIVPISKISNSRGADQKYKLNCNGKAIMYRAKNLNNHVMPRGLP
ncbi:hypothetical protein J6590_096708 [Homalodisca vitripennis]|nr:hypothetical protein J6590_096708 [Homalodisca vitripennis]